MTEERDIERVEREGAAARGIARRAFLGRSAVAGAGLAGISTLVAACGGGASGNQDASKAASVGSSKGTSGSGTSDGGGLDDWGLDPSKVGKKKIGLIQVLASSQGSVRIFSGAKATAPGWDIQEFDAVGDAAKGANAWDNFLQSGVDGMMFIGFPYEAFAAKVRAASAKGVPVIAIASNYGPGVSCAVGMLGTLGGLNMGVITADNLNYKGNYAIVNSPNLVLIQKQRQLGFESALRAYDGFKKVAEYELDFAKPQDDGAAKMEQLLQKFPKGNLDAVFFGWDLPAGPASEVARSRGREEIWISGTDGDTDALERIRAGHRFVTTAPNMEALGALAVKQLAQIFDGGKPDGKAIYIDEPGVYAANVQPGKTNVFPPRPVTYTKAV